MKYSNDWVRRKDRLLEETDALHRLHTGEYGILSMQAEDGGAYGIPVNYVWNGETSIYIHCAPEGRKLECLASCNRVSFCVVGSTCVVSDQFSTAYESIILTGTAHTGLPESERMSALRLLLEKYSPDDMEAELKYAEKSFHRTEIIRLDIADWSGKCKRIR